MSELPAGKRPIEKAVEQLKKVCESMPFRPISRWDSEYGCAPFVLKTASIQADILVRLRSNLCLWATPPAYSGKGRPRKHGAQFKLSEPDSWGFRGICVGSKSAEIGRSVRQNIPEVTSGIVRRTS